MSLNLRQMEVFRAIMISGSLVGAARMLKVSQPAISRMLSSAEARIGVALFERMGRRLKPTPEALRLLAAVDDVYKQVQRVNDITRDMFLQRSGGLRVVASPSPGRYVVPRVIRSLHDLLPTIQLELEVQTIAELIRNVASGHAEIGVVNIPADQSNLDVTNIFDARLMCIFPADHPLAARKAVRIQDIKDYHVISYHRDTPYGMLVDGFLSRARQPLTSNVYVRFSNTACSLVEAGAGIAFVDELAVHGSVSQGVAARPVAPRQLMPVSVLTAKGQPLSTTAKSFLHFLRLELRKIRRP